MVAAYKVSPLEAVVIKRLVRVPSYILANLVIGENIVPELMQDDCTPEQLADALVPLIGDTPERRRQVEAFRLARHHHGDRLARAGGPRRRYRAGLAAAARSRPDSRPAATVSHGGSR